MVYIFLGEGFEEIEAIVPLDILRRANLEVATVSMTGDTLVLRGHGLVVKADITLEQIDFDSMKMLVLPGGGGGVASIANTPAAMDLIRRTWEADKMIGAICAAPSLLAALNIINGKRVICYPTVAEVVEAAGGKLQPQLSVALDSNLITAKAAGSAIEFSLELVAALCGPEASEEIRHAILFWRAD
jgi:4-methyl-5(b-hydroxyethyl)-thiazole monophosphate biosynthesis